MFQFFHDDKHTNNIKSNPREESTLKSCYKATGANEKNVTPVQLFSTPEAQSRSRDSYLAVWAAPSSKAEWERLSFSLVRK